MTPLDNEEQAAFDKRRHERRRELEKKKTLNNGISTHPVKRRFRPTQLR
jgi:hypothetical protein